MSERERERGFSMFWSLPHSCAPFLPSTLLRRRVTSEAQALKPKSLPQKARHLLDLGVRMATVNFRFKGLRLFRRVLDSGLVLWV